MYLFQTLSKAEQKVIKDFYILCCNLELSDEQKAVFLENLNTMLGKMKPVSRNKLIKNILECGESLAQ
jgi:hypothetical protein